MKAFFVPERSTQDMSYRIVQSSKDIKLGLVEKLSERQKRNQEWAGRKLHQRDMKYRQFNAAANRMIRLNFGVKS